MNNLADIVSEISWSGVQEMMKNHISAERNLVIHLHQQRAIELIEEINKQFPTSEAINPLSPFTYNRIRVKVDYPFYNEIILTDERLVQKGMDEAIMKWQL